MKWLILLLFLVCAPLAVYGSRADFTNNVLGPFILQNESNGLTVTNNEVRANNGAVATWAHLFTTENSTVNTTGGLNVSAAFVFPTDNKNICFGIWSNGTGMLSNVTGDAYNRCQFASLAGGTAAFGKDIMFYAIDAARLYLYAQHDGTIQNCQIGSTFSTSTQYYLRWIINATNSTVVAHISTSPTFATVAGSCGLLLDSAWPATGVNLTHFFAADLATKNVGANQNQDGRVDNLTWECPACQGATPPPPANVSTGVTLFANDNETNTSLNAFNVTVGTRNVSLTNLLLAYNFAYPTINGSNITDISPNNFSATVSGATYNSTGGNDARGAYTFNGAANVITVDNNDTALRLEQGGTIITWVNATGAGGGGSGRIVEKSDGASAQNGYAIDIDSTGHLSFYLNTAVLLTTTGNLTFGRWYFIVARLTTNNITIYRDGISIGSATYVGAIPAGTPPLRIGNRFALDRGWQGGIAEVILYNRTLSETEILAINNSQVQSNTYQVNTSAGINLPLDNNPWNLSLTYSADTYTPLTYLDLLNLRYYFTGNLSHLENLSFAAFEVGNNQGIQGLTVTISNSTYSASNATLGLTVNFTYYRNGLVGLYNVTFVNTTYFNRTIEVQFNGTGAFVSTTLTRYYNLTLNDYSNYLPAHGENWTRNLVTSLTYRCPSFDTGARLLTYINGTLNVTENLVCTNNLINITRTYTHFREGNFTIRRELNTSWYPWDNNVSTATNRFTSDLFAPTMQVLNLTSADGFYNATINASMRCSDTIFTPLSYNMTFNGNQLFLGNVTQNTTQLNVTTPVDGTNTLEGHCSDLFYTTNGTNSLSLFIKQMILINELINQPLSNILLQNLTIARAYYDDNRTYWDFKLGSGPYANVSSPANAKLRFDLQYPDGTVITRWVDLSLVTSTELRVCANPVGTLHYEQLIISSIQRPVVLRSVFSDCLVASDYTRFAYQDALVLKAYTIPVLYYLYTFDAGHQVLLASLDGSIASFINLDNLEFNSQGYNLNILNSALNVQKTGPTEVTLFYSNLQEDNTALNLMIERMDTNSLVFNTSTFMDPNEFQLIFDYSALLNVSNNTLFRVTLTRTTASETIVDMSYFSIMGSEGFLSSQVSFVFAFLLTAFGLTFAVSRITFSWFGIAMLLTSLGTLGFSVSTWYNIVLATVDLILLVYCVILMLIRNNPTVVQ